MAKPTNVQRSSKKTNKIAVTLKLWLLLVHCDWFTVTMPYVMNFSSLLNQIYISSGEHFLHLPSKRFYLT